MSYRRARAEAARGVVLLSTCPARLALPEPEQPVLQAPSLVLSDPLAHRPEPLAPLQALTQVRVVVRCCQAPTNRFLRAGP